MLCTDSAGNIASLVQALVNVFTPQINAHTTRHIPLLEEQAKVQCRAAIKRLIPDRTLLRSLLTDLGQGIPQLKSEDYIRVAAAGCPLHRIQPLMVAEWSLLVRSNTSIEPAMLDEVINDPNGWRRSVARLKARAGNPLAPPCLSEATIADELYTWKPSEVASYVEALLAAPMAEHALRRLNEPGALAINDVPSPPWASFHEELVDQFKPVADPSVWLNFIPAEPLTLPQAEQQIHHIMEEWISAFLEYAAALSKRRVAEVKYNVCVQLERVWKHLRSVAAYPLKILESHLPVMDQAIVDIQSMKEAADVARQKAVVAPSMDLNIRFCSLAGWRSKQRRGLDASGDLVMREVYQDLDMVSRLTRARLDLVPTEFVTRVHLYLQERTLQARHLVQELKELLGAEEENAKRVQLMWVRELYNGRVHLLSSVVPSLFQVAQWSEMSKLIPGFSPVLFSGVYAMQVTRWMDQVALDLLKNGMPLLLSSSLYYNQRNNIVSAVSMSE